MLAGRMRRTRERRMIHEDRAAIIVVDFGTRGVAVRAPVRVLDGGRVVMIVIVVSRQVDVRRRQQGRDDSGRHQQRGGDRPAESGRNHVEILSQ